MMEDIVDSIRAEPFHTLWNNCLIKSVRFKRACARRGIEARVVVSFGYTRVNRHLRLIIPIVHAWGEVDGCRVELARPLDEPSLWGTLDSEIKPLVAIWL